MAIFRSGEVTQLSEVEIVEQLDKLRFELVRHNGKVAAGGATENPGQIRELRRTIARLLTEQTRRKAA
jgi:large subunit ribosomal protein L29